jgi:hypothetical protein
MTKTRKQITDTLDQVIVVDDTGEELTYLNGVIQMTAGKKFMAARSVWNGQLSLIIEDYVHWVNNQTAIEAWIEQHSSGIRQEGMMLYFDHDADRTMFLLRWG